MPGRHKDDLTGRRFGKLEVLRLAGARYGHVQWLCKCDCGTEAEIGGSHLRRGNTRSCGCWRRQFSVVTKTTHGMAAKNPKRRSRLYHVWNAMKQRCHNPRASNYERYGALGITVCEEWRNSFEAFYRDMGNPPADGQRWTLDRIDVFKGYEPGNVRWATYKEQNQPENKRPVVDVATVKQKIAELRDDPQWALKLEAMIDQAHS